MARILTTLLVVAAVGAAGAFAAVASGGAALLGWALLAAVAATAMARPFRGSGLAATAIASLAFLAVQLYDAVRTSGQAVNPGQLLPGLEGALMLAVVGLLAEVAARRLEAIGRKMRQDAALIEELTPREELTGALKSTHLQGILADEIERARKYGRKLSVVMLEPDDWPAAVRAWGKEKSMEIIGTLGRLLVGGVRPMDTVSRLGESRFLIVLPETPVEGAQVAAERLCLEATSRTGLTFRSGVAEFPGDAVTKDDLVAEAEAALEFARNARLTVASRRLLA